MTPSLDETRAHANALIDEVERAIVGKRDVLELVLIALLCRGHVLFEDFPGLAKTLMARCFARVLGLDFSRIQFTPDLLPSDITGSFIYDQRKSTFEFRRGPLFANLVLGDEINRAPPKTQAALLEAMQEGQVTVEDQTYPLAPPFAVIATQNPIEFEGTYPLPEAQLDRFMIRAAVGYPSEDQEWEILKRRLDRSEDEIPLRAIVDPEELLTMQASIEKVHVDETIGRYIVDLVTASRAHADIEVGASPRGALATLKMARGRAVLSDRDFVTPEDVKAVAIPALAHRLTLRPELWVRRIVGDDIVRSLLETVPTPPPVQ
ncbi:MAG: AAA family ATPase [Actinomycetota bacterium]